MFFHVTQAYSISFKNTQIAIHQHLESHDSYVDAKVDCYSNCDKYSDSGKSQNQNHNVETDRKGLYQA